MNGSVNCNSLESKKRIAILSYKNDIISKKIYRILKRRFSVKYASENPAFSEEYAIEFDNTVSIGGFLDYYSIDTIVVCSSIFDSDYSLDLLNRLKEVLNFALKRNIKPIFIYEKYRVSVNDFDDVTILGCSDKYENFCSQFKKLVISNKKGLVITCPTTFGFDINLPYQKGYDLLSKSRNKFCEFDDDLTKFILVDKVAEILSESIDLSGDLNLYNDDSVLDNFKDNKSFENIKSILLRQNGCAFNLIYQLMPYDYFGEERVANVRINLGKKLSESIPKDISENVDYIVPVPKTGLFYAMGLSLELKIPYMQGLLKENTSDRCFQLVDVNARKKFLKNKICPIDEILKGKTIILVDEAIFTGTTLKMVCNMLWELGVKKIYIAIPTPQCFVSCDYYVQPKREMLLQYIREDMLNEYFGVENVFFQKVENFNELIPDVNGLCTECFTRR